MRQYHWWIVAKDEAGKTILIYGAPMEDAARERAFEMLPGIEFELRRLPTKDLGRASAMLKGNLLETTHDLKKATRRLRHKVGKTTQPEAGQSSPFGGGMTSW